VACTTDDAGDEGTGGTSGGGAGPTGGTLAGGAAGDTSTGGSGPGTGGNTSTAASRCEISSVPPGPVLVDFEACTVGATGEDAVCAFPVGGSGTNYAGPFAYSDSTTFVKEVVAGDGSLAAYGISDTLSSFSAGVGVWMGCVDASSYDGIQFRIRGTTPMGTAHFSIMMNETSLPNATTPADGGTCTGTATTCVAPTYVVASVTDAWTLVQVPWSAFTPGTNGTATVVPDGSDIWQVQWDVDFEWLDDGSGTYVMTPAAYELQVDDVAFY
jgi:hypothetical protein